MKIYFDEVLVPDDNYMSYSDNFSSFDDTFCLGSCSSLKASMQIPLTAWPGYVENVVVEINGERIATLKLDDITVNDDETITLSLVDILTHTETECDFSNLITYTKTYDPETDTWTESGTGITAKDLLDFICDSYHITKEDFHFTNEDVMIYSYDSTLTGRDYLEMIAELAGGYIVINEGGNLELRYYFRYENGEKTFAPESDKVLSAEDIDNFKLTEQITIERVVYDDGVNVPKRSSDNEDLYTLYLSIDNMFLQQITDAQFTNICNNIIGYSFYNIKIDNTNKFFTPGSTIWFEKPNLEKVPILVNYTRDYLGGFVGSYETNVSCKKRTETEVIPTDIKIKRIKTIINQMDNSMTIEAGKVANLQGKTTQLRIDIDKVQSLFQITGGSNLIKNSQFLLSDETWNFIENSEDPLAYHTPIGEGYNSSLIGETIAVANIVLRNSKAITKIDNITNLKLNTHHTLNYYVSQDSNTTTTIKLISKITGEEIYNEVITTDNSHTINMKNYTFDFIPNDTDYYLQIESTTILDGYVRIYDLMLNSGDKKSWEPAQSEVYSTILKMSQQGFQVYSAGSNILTLVTSDGFQIREARDSGDGGIILGRIVSQFNNEGIITEIVRMTKAVIGKYVQEELKLNNITHHVEYFEE